MHEQTALGLMPIFDYFDASYALLEQCGVAVGKYDPAYCKVVLEARRRSLRTNLLIAGGALLLVGGVTGYWLCGRNR